MKNHNLKRISVVGIIIATFSLSFLGVLFLAPSNNENSSGSQNLTNQKIINPKISDDSTPKGNNGPFWRYQMYDAIEYQSVISKGLICTITNDGGIECLNTSTGSEQWYEFSCGVLTANPQTWNGMLYFATDDGSGDIYSINITSQSLSLLYQNTFDFTSIALSNGLLYAVDDVNLLVCINATSGAIIWSYQTNDEDGFNAVLVSNGTVYATNNDQYVYYLNATTGNSGWKRFTSGIPTAVGVTNGMMYVGKGSELDCYSLPTANYKWGYTYSTNSISSSITVWNGMIYYGCKDDNLYCVNASTGALKWQYATKGEIYSNPAISNGLLYIGSDDNKLYCLNATTGVLEWNYATGSKVDANPVIFDGRVYVGSYDEHLYCFPMIMPSSAPLNVNLTAGNGEIKLNWNPPSLTGGSPITGYKIYRQASGNNTIYNFTVGNVNQYIDTGLTNNLTYRYEVTAINIAGESPKSNTASGTPEKNLTISNSTNSTNSKNTGKSVAGMNVGEILSVSAFGIIVTTVSIKSRNNLFKK